MKTLIHRHLKLFLKSPSNMILSFLSSGVILSLYFLFIRDFTIKAVQDYGFISTYNDLFVDKLMTSGLLIVIGATSILPIIFIFVKDCSMGIIKDFLITPISYYNILSSYFFASLIVSMITTLFVYLGIELFFIFHYHFFSSITVILLSILVLFFSNMIASMLLLLIALTIHEFTSFSTFQTLFGVVIGFFTGVYIPIGYYPNLIQTIFFYFPLCQTTSMLRNLQTHSITNKILSSYPEQTHSILYETFGIHLSSNHHVISLEQQWIMMFIILIIFYLIFLLIVTFKNYHK